MQAIRRIWGITWRGAIVGVGYVLALVVAGMVSGVLGVRVSEGGARGASLLGPLVSGVLMAFLLGPVASRMPASRWRHFLVWWSVIFFNMGSVAIEGAFFAPDLVPIPLPVLFVQQLLASAAAASLITLLFSSPGERASLLESLRLRPWYAWAWRFVVSSLAYLVFYFVFGAINYSLVTGPYYASHAGGLTLPAPGLVLTAELIRAPLIILSTISFVFTFRAGRRRLGWITGLVLFWVGGVVPLVLQVRTLPLLLLAASAAEIFFQNFLTGVVAASLFWTPEVHAAAEEGG